jgi:hypothetical protein
LLRAFMYALYWAWSLSHDFTVTNISSVPRSSMVNTSDHCLRNPAVTSSDQPQFCSGSITFTSFSSFTLDVSAGSGDSSHVPWKTR